MTHSTAATVNSSLAWATPAVFSMSGTIRHDNPGGTISASPRFALALLLAFAPLLSWAESSAPTAPLAVLYRTGWPLFFEPGPSGHHAATNFLARGPNFQLVLAPAEADFLLRRPESAPAPVSVRRDQALQMRSSDVRAVRISFPGAHPEATISGSQLREGKVNY